ncbi:unnamed protein product [Gongylonema pulchrum]|uniref:BPL/LPL catalytic domain-containing protein n=1 Tax=Gongylonema pulchrum TaxID=637853 RepID=A0A183EMX3_9BILA|nr:unnamed protein product [Gongylonema pulchrum]
MAYHHMTLLINADPTVLKRSLSSPFSDKIITNATRSVRAPSLGYLAQEVPDISVEEVMDILMKSFKKQYLDTKVLVLSENLTDDAQFPGLLECERELRSWDWIYGRTPQFTLPLYSDRIRVEQGIVTESAENPKLIGNRLPQDLFQAYLGFSVEPLLGIDLAKQLAHWKAYLRETPTGYDPKIVALQATVVTAFFGALLYPLIAYFTGDSSVVSEKKRAV